MPVIYRELMPHEFKEALTIRIKVFVEEQHVPIEEEHDSYDQVAQHFGVFLDRAMVGTGRLVTQGQSGKIGRIAILKEFRGQGFGRALIETIITSGENQGLVEFVLGAQLQALDFYEKLGFIPEGAIFLDGGIAHRTMRLRIKIRKEDEE